YTILTVGDGLISQVPALIISTAAGVVVTKVTTEVTLGSKVITQFAIQPRALGTAAGILFLLGWIPGLPGFPLLTLSVLSWAAGYFFRGARLTADDSAASQEAPQPLPPEPAADPMDDLTPIELLALEVGYGLIALVDSERDGELLERIKTLRRQMAQELGVIVP